MIKVALEGESLGFVVKAAVVNDIPDGMSIFPKCARESNRSSLLLGTVHRFPDRRLAFLYRSDGSGVGWWQD